MVRCNHHGSTSPVTPCQNVPVVSAVTSLVIRVKIPAALSA